MGSKSNLQFRHFSKIETPLHVLRHILSHDACNMYDKVKVSYTFTHLGPSPSQKNRPKAEPKPFTNRLKHPPTLQTFWRVEDIFRPG